jgi:hypothetical protein
MAATIYFFVAAGFCSATGKFWISMGWPFYLGELLGKEIVKRDML